MLKLYINATDVSSYLEDGSLTINKQLQNRASTCSFELANGVTEPTQNQEVKIYDTVKLVSASGTAVVIQDVLRNGLSLLTYGKYRVGQYFWLGIGISTEERVTISAIAAGSAGQVNITLSAAIVNAHSANEVCGSFIFGGVLTSINKSNPKMLADVVYECGAASYVKIFDRKIINDSWTDVDARYIVNDFLDTTINYNQVLDNMDYANTTALRAEWIESGDGGNPTLDTTNIIQGTGAAIFDWTNSGGTATFSATPTSVDVSDLTGAASGTPTKGNITLWYKRSSASGITSIAVRVGSDASNYAQVSFTPVADTNYNFKSMKLTLASITGTPVWTAVDYLAVVVTETTTANVIIDDIRLTANGSFTMYNFEQTTTFDDVRAPFKKPTVFVDRLAKALGWSWHVDNERDIHFYDFETTFSPFSVTDTSNNFDNLQVDVDTSQLKNRQIVRGGTKESDSLYSQVVEGNAAVREWIMKAQFKNLTIKLDNNTSTDTCEAGTTTTNITAVAHGLVTGDYIVNRTRSNAVRKVTLVDVDNFTVEAVTSQTSGDTFSKFATSQTVGLENIVDETTVNYVSNFTEKSIRAGSATATLPSGSFLLFSYNEIVPIRVQATDYASVAAMKAIVGGDGVFDGAVITDTSLNTTQMARDRAQAEINQFANAIVTIKFKTDFEGLDPGQLLTVSDTAKNINDDYLIQRVKLQFKTGDYAAYDVQASSTLFGIIEYLQKLQALITDRLIDEDEVIDQIVSEGVTITITESNTTGAGESASESATITVTPSETATERDITTDPYQWQPDASPTKWSLFQWMS